MEVIRLRGWKITARVPDFTPGTPADLVVLDIELLLQANLDHVRTIKDAIIGRSRGILLLLSLFLLRRLHLKRLHLLLQLPYFLLFGIVIVVDLDGSVGSVFHHLAFRTTLCNHAFGG